MDATKEIKTQPRKPITTPKWDTIFRVALLVLLSLILIVQVISVSSEMNRRKACDEQLALVSVKIEDLSTAYSGAVYSNPSVDNINKQQLMVGEFQFLTEQAIAQLLTVCR